MDIERALLKAGVTVAAMFAIYQGSQEYRSSRSNALLKRVMKPKRSDQNKESGWESISNPFDWQK